MPLPEVLQVTYHLAILRLPAIQRASHVTQDDLNVPIAERRSRRTIALPKRYIHPLPEAAPSIPPGPPPSPPRGPSVSSRVRKIIRTPKNVFGLVRQYFTHKLPTADPEDLVTLADLTSIRTSQPPVDPRPSRNPFKPYPNKSSFRLGNYFWNGSVQKTHADFKELIAIVGDPEYNPIDVRETKWDKINETLGDVDAVINDDGDQEWLDEAAGWIKTRIEMSVPFAKNTESPGNREYSGADLYHRSIVEVLKERISDPHAGERFHMEPYQLKWQPSDQHEEVQMHGEMYTSKAFIEAHDALQNSPSEPDCDLQKVVVAMMFWSDSTHLTSFGNAHLWPCYLFLGNESKYRRCKPSCNLCSHIAYFQSVCASASQ